MSILTKWWHKESTKVILKASLSILKVLAGKIANDLWTRATASVQQAQNLPLDGPQKAKYVLDDIRSQWKDIEGYIANLAVELAVAHLKAGLSKR